MRGEEAPFSRRSVAWIAGTCALSMAAGILFSVFGGELGARPAWGPTSFSPSALGHSGFAAVLRRLGIPLLVSRDASGPRAAAGGVLVVAEPPGAEGVRGMIASSRAALLVLPKWTGKEHFLRRDWVAEVEALEVSHVRDVAASVLEKASLLRIEGGGAAWVSGLGPLPSLRAAQLLSAGDGIEPLVHCREGILLAEIPHPGGGERRLLLLSDPDLLANHGLPAGGNADLLLAALEDLRGGKGAVVLDETLHGYRRSSSLWRELLSFPLALASLAALLTAALLAWTAGVRFGAPAPEPPALEQGKGFLVENTARLLRAGGHDGHALARYWLSSLHAVAEALRAPGHPGSAEAVAFLDRLAEARGLPSGPGALSARVKEAAGTRGPAAGKRILETARAVHDWRKGMTRGA